MRRYFGHRLLLSGRRVCRRFFSEERCQYADFMVLTKNGKTIGRRWKVFPGRRDTEALRLAIQKILDHPFRVYAIYSTRISQDAILGISPNRLCSISGGLSRLFSVGLFKDSLRLIVSFLTIFLFIFVLCSVYRYRFQLYELTPSAEEVQICFCLTHYFHLCWTLFFFSIVTRYALPLGSLYLLCIAYTFQKYFHREKFNLKMENMRSNKDGEFLKTKME